MGRTAAKPQRTLRVCERIDRTYIPAVLVTDGPKSDAYRVFTSPGTVHWDHRAGGGRYYRVECVGGKPSTCNCPAGTYRGTCRHLAATAKLIAVGELAAPADERDTPDGYLHTSEVVEQTM